MLRSSEFLSRGGAGWDWAKVLRPQDVELRCDGRRLEIQEFALANEMSIFLRSSKTDQFNEGTVLTHHLAGSDNLDLCVVRAFRDLGMQYPEVFRDEASMPLSRWESGAPVTRDQVRRLLAEAAAARGVAVEAMGVHSLRSGGASALYHATGGNKSLVQRLGRWASEAFSGYVWEDRTLTRGLAGAMLAAPWAAHAAAY